jgi:ribonuclease VapC
LLALLNGEPGADVVEEALAVSVISSVNLCEVIGKLCEAGMTEKVVRQTLQTLGLKIISFDEEQSYQAGIIRKGTREAGLSLGDRACLSLAKVLGVAALTADRSWAVISVGVKVRVIR